MSYVTRLRRKGQDLYGPMRLKVDADNVGETLVVEARKIHRSDPIFDEPLLGSELHEDFPNAADSYVVLNEGLYRRNGVEDLSVSKSVFLEIQPMRIRRKLEVLAAYELLED
jgi:hypothetical protein